MTSRVEGPWPPSATFTNPVLWEDLADDEIIRVGDTFYYTASNMHYSPGAPIWLRVAADIRPGSNRQGRFSYSTDGTTFTSIGSAHTLNNDWQFFMGYRFGIFNYATSALGGAVTVKSFEVATP